MYYDDFCDEYAAQDRKIKRYQQELQRHPDSRDPDYPGDIEDDGDE